MFRFTIRDVLWLTIAAALVLTLLPQIQRRREAQRVFEAMKQIERPHHIPTKADYDSLPFGRVKSSP